VGPPVEIAPAAETAARHRRGPRLLQSVFSFASVLVSLLIVLTVFTVRSRFGDPDMWWHLQTGALIWNSHVIPRVDPFSFSAVGQPWIAQEWLSEVTIYGAWLLGGFSGLMLWVCTIGSLVVIAGYALCWLYSGNGKIAFAGAMGIWFFGTIGLVVRPHLMGYFLLVCEMLILQLARTRDTRWYYALPAVFALWVNFHSSFIIGIIVLAIVFGSSLVKFRAGFLVSTPLERRARVRFCAGFALSIAALALNPIGPRLIWYPFDVLMNQQLNVASVAEWQPASFSDIRAWLLIAAAGLILLIPLVRKINLRLDELGLLAVGFGLAVQHERMLFIFGIIAMPIICRLLADTWQGYESGRELVVVNGVLLAIVALAVVSGFPDARLLAAQLEQAAPVRAVDFIRRSGLPGPMLNEYVYGGYLIWAAPEHPVFIDGRADVYEPAGVLAQYGRWATLREDPRLLLDKYRIRLCLVSRDHPISRVMPLLADWKMVYSDPVSIVFARQ
jgi:hypothetical protein